MLALLWQVAAKAVWRVLKASRWARSGRTTGAVAGAFSVKVCGGTATAGMVAYLLRRICQEGVG
jgi:hypothetical protein